MKMQARKTTWFAFCLCLPGAACRQLVNFDEPPAPDVLPSIRDGSVIDGNLLEQPPRAFISPRIPANSSCATPCDRAEHGLSCGRANAAFVVDKGPGSDEDAGVSSDHPVSVSTSNHATCALMDSGQVRCWGGNDRGQVGDGTRVNRSQAVPVTGLRGVVQVEVGLVHTCALINDGTVRCWGANDGALLDGSDNDRATPVLARDLADVKQLSLGNRLWCARKRDDSLFCHVPTWEKSNSLSEIDRAIDVRDVEINYQNVALWRSDGSVQMIGQGNLLGWLDDEPCVKEVVGGYDHTCVLIHDGSVRCTGDGSEGPPNGELLGLRQAVGITAGFQHTCALVEAGLVYCWGEGSTGRLGTGSDDDQMRPTQVQGLERVLQVSAGSEHTCALRDDGHVFCWGSNQVGQLGDTTHNDSSVPVEVRGLSN